jgi:hypothetical protein
MQSTPTFFGPSTIPFVPIGGRAKPRPADLVDQIRQQMATADPAKQDELLALGIDVLRKRQRDRERAAQDWRSDHGLTGKAGR